jgi:internalin A
MKPIVAIMKLGGQIERDEKTPGLPVVEVILSGDKATDAGLKHLAALAQLKSLQLIKTKVTDAGLKDLATLKQLQRLNFYATEITDAGLKGSGRPQAASGVVPE